MNALKQLIFIGCFTLFGFSMSAQNKYALLIGISDYYEEKGIKSIESLNGPVNDANAMRQLLISKFGFKPANIDTVYNAAATRSNIIDNLNKYVKKCKKDDIMVFYYSGHGVWMNNSAEATDPIKNGMSQAMLTSDLYNYRDHFKCFLRDFTLKQYFNKFVAKNVILTSIFDCCFGGNLAMSSTEQPVADVKEKSVDFFQLMSRLTNNSEELIDSISGISILTPAGCQVDSMGAIKDTLDSDGDGVPDCKDREKLTDMACRPVTDDGIGRCPFDSSLQKTLNRFDAAELKKDNEPASAADQARSFNAAEVLSISEKDNVARPSETKRSKFLFVSATSDVQKGFEFKDQDNVVHGLFTAAMLRVFKKYSANISIEFLLKKVQEDMDSYHKNQTLTLHADPARTKFNLTGTKLVKP